YDYRLRLRQLSSDLVHVFDERELLRRLGDQLTEVLERETVAVYARDARSRALVQRYPESEATFEGADVGAIEAITEPMLTVELEAMGSPVAGRFAEWGWEVVLPLRVKDRLTGLVGLGRNRDLRI